MFNQRNATTGDGLKDTRESNKEQLVADFELPIFSLTELANAKKLFNCPDWSRRRSLAQGVDDGSEPGN